jgi:hypothetical protein
LSPILFNFYGKYLIKEACEGFGDVERGGPVILTVKYSDDLVPLAGGETVLQGVIDSLSEVGRCCGMEINVQNI